MSNYVIRCNNCYKIFKDEEDLKHVYEENDKEFVFGCDVCKTDAYLFDIKK